MPTGLTRPLASLYLLAFAYYGEPRTELVLAAGHGLTLEYGAPVRGDRLAKEFMPYLPWREDGFVGKFVGLRLPVGEVSWNNTLQYTSVLAQGLTQLPEDSREVPLQERELLGALADLRGEDRQGAGGAGETRGSDALSQGAGIPCPGRPRLGGVRGQRLPRSLCFGRVDLSRSPGSDRGPGAAYPVYVSGRTGRRHSQRSGISGRVVDPGRPSGSSPWYAWPCWRSCLPR